MTILVALLLATLIMTVLRAPHPETKLTNINNLCGFQIYCAAAALKAGRGRRIMVSYFNVCYVMYELRLNTTFRVSHM